MKRLRIPSDPAFFRRARRWAATIAREAGFDERDVRDLEIALSEACSNAHRHAYGGRTDGFVDLEAADDATAITIAVRDYAGHFRPESYRPPSPDSPGEGGYGLYLMRCLVDEVEVRNMDPGVEVLLRKRRKRPPAAA
jgi:serine/threonine-protein kinase RsbW